MRRNAVATLRSSRDVGERGDERREVAESSLSAVQTAPASRSASSRNSSGWPVSSRSACADARSASTDDTGGNRAADKASRLAPGTAAATDSKTSGEK